jgi:hypothetical protein
MLLRRFGVLSFSACVFFILFTPAAMFSQETSPSHSVIRGSLCITDSPFSAEMVTTRVQTLADGTQVTEVSKVLKARDSQGRTIEESYPPQRGNSGPGATDPLFITIQDGVSGQLVQMSPHSKRASISTYPLCETPDFPHAGVIRTPPRIQDALAGEAGNRSQVAATESRPLFQSENLGDDTIHGIFAEGTRVTQIIPAGTQGNNRDITTVTERWDSPELGMAVLTKINDPRTGEITVKLRDLNRDEPSPDLFQIPADYTITSAPNETH